MRNRRIILEICIILALLIIAVFYYYIAYQDLTVFFYELHLDVKESIRIVQLSDLHNTEFGKENSDLIKLVNKQEPDLIFMSGDMLNGDDPNEDVILRLISSLKDVAPVYYGYGNHEFRWESQFKKNLKYDLEETGAIVVNNNYYDIDFKGSMLRIGGYMGYYRQPHMFTKNKYLIRTEKEFADDFENTNRIKLLINHIPTQWVDWHYIDKYPVDVVFSGHYHGGTVRIPFVNQGVFAPYVGWFPPYTKGVFTGKYATCVLSSGLGDEHGMPRINNPPEIVVVDLVPNE